MQLHNGLITLDYDPATDILATTMPDVREFGTEEVAYCLNMIVDSIIGYDIKYLLLDASTSVINVEEEAYKAVSMKFGIDLLDSRLEKLARVGTADSKREEKAAKVSAELREEVNLPLEFQNFANREEAMIWLLGK